MENKDLGIKEPCKAGNVATQNNSTPRSTNDGGPAFPCSTWKIEDGVHIGTPVSGMSLRDYFAAHCPSDLAKCNVQSDAEEIAGPYPASHPTESNFPAELAWNNRVEAYLRYSYADAMLAARGEAPSVHSA